MARTAKGTPPAYQLHRTSGRAKVVIGGVTHWLGRHGSPESLAAYSALIDQWRVAIAAAPSAPIVVTPRLGGITITELVVAYTQWADNYYLKDGVKTSETYNVRDAIRPVRIAYGNLRVSEFTPRSLMSVFDTIVRTGVCRRTANRRLSRIKGMFKWGVARELVPHAVYGALTAVSGLARGRRTDAGLSAPDRPAVAPVTDADIDATLPHLPGVLADMVRVQRLTGMRPEEVCGLTPGEIDRTSRRDGIWVYSPSTFKTEHHEGATRRIPIGPTAQSILAPYLLRSPATPCFSPREAYAQRRAAETGRRPNQKPTARRTARTMREAFDSDSYRKAIGRAAVVADVRKWAPNQLRHAAGTAVRNEFGLEAAQVLLGHAHAKTTEIYAESNFEKAANAMAKVG